MAKRQINSEITIPDNDFRIKIGTVDRKNPSVIYLTISLYAKPTEKPLSYTEEVRDMEKEIKRGVSSTFSKTGNCNHQFIFITDVPYERMSVKKKTYMEIQIYTKPSASLVEKTGNNFNSMANVIGRNDIVEIIGIIKNTLRENLYEYGRNR